MWVSPITSPVTLVLGLLGGLTWRFRVVTGGPPVTVYLATRPVFGILGWVTGVIRRSWVGRIILSVPPCPHLLGLGQPVEQYPAAGSRVEQGTSVRISVAQKRIEDLTVDEISKRQSHPRPDSLPDEPESRSHAYAKPDSLPDESEPRSQVRPSSQRPEEPSSEGGRNSEKPQDLPN